MVVAAGLLALNGILEKNVTEIILAGLLVPVALWLGRSLKKRVFLQTLIHRGPCR